MVEEIGFENGKNSNFEGLVTLTLTLDPAIRHTHTVVHHSSTSTYIPNFIQIKETFCGRTDGRTDGRMYGRTFFPPLILLGRLLEVDLTTTTKSPVIYACHVIYASNVLVNSTLNIFVSAKKGSKYITYA